MDARNDGHATDSLSQMACSSGTIQSLVVSHITVDDHVTAVVPVTEEECNETSLEDWELFYEETSQLEYDEEELLCSTFASTPNDNCDDDVLNIDVTLNPSQNFIQNEQLLIEGIIFLCTFTTTVKRKKNY